MKKLTLAILICTTFSLARDLYTDTYMARSGIIKHHIETGIPNPFNVNRIRSMKNTYHASIYFKDGKITQSSLKKLQELLTEAKQRKEGYFITVIGHTSGFTNESHIITLSPWAEFWHNLGNRKMSKTELAETVNVRIRAVYNYLRDHKVPAKNIYNENRMDRDPLVTEATEEGRSVNQRVDIALYR
jgi:hypothetical protein